MKAGAALLALFLRPDGGRALGAALAPAADDVQTSPVLLEDRDGWTIDTADRPPPIAPLAALRLANASAVGARSIVIEPCDVMAPLPARCVFALAEGSANEEYVRSAGACACAAAAARCSLASALRYEHGRLEPLQLMPPTFQPPEAGRLLNARPEPFATVQHERAAAVVARAQQWISLSAHTLGGGRDKLALRRLLFALCVSLLAACACAALLRVLRSGRKGRR
jgi:hypothetical protein